MRWRRIGQGCTSLTVYGTDGETIPHVGYTALDARRHSQQVIEHIAQEIEEFRKDAQPNDDLTMMCLRVDNIT